MIHHISLCPEAEPAILRAGERTRILVDEHVRLKVLLFRKGFIAAINGALERLSSEMHVHMGSVSVKPPE